MPARLPSSPERRTIERRTITARGRATELERRGSYAEALRILDEVRTFCRSQRDHHGVAACDERIGRVLLAFQRPSEALKRYSSARAFYVRAELPVEASRAEIAVATALSHLGGHDDALEHLERARDAFGRNGDLSVLAASHLETGVVLTKVDRDWETDLLEWRDPWPTGTPSGQTSRETQRRAQTSATTTIESEADWGSAGMERLLGARPGWVLELRG